MIHLLRNWVRFHKDFSGDDGSTEFCKQSGIYDPSPEAEVDFNRLTPVPWTVVRNGRCRVFLTFGQSNTANSGEYRHRAPPGVFCFNFFDQKFYPAQDPLPGASNQGGSVWPPLGDLLIRSHWCDTVIFISVGFGGSFVQDWQPGGRYFRRLHLAVRRFRSVCPLPIDLLLWQQGEAEANHTHVSSLRYLWEFAVMLAGIRGLRLSAPLICAVSTLCEGNSPGTGNRVAIRRAQRWIPRLLPRVRPGPDFDTIGFQDRFDRCHFSKNGQDRAAHLWKSTILSNY